MSNANSENFYAVKVKDNIQMIEVKQPGLYVVASRVSLWNNMLGKLEKIRSLCNASVYWLKINCN